MTTLRFAAFTLAALSLGCIAVTPNSPATLWLTGLFFTFFAIVCLTCREPKRARRGHDS